jgi:hypothetical protein
MMLSLPKETVKQAPPLAHPEEGAPPPDGVVPHHVRSLARRCAKTLHAIMPRNPPSAS